MSNAIFTTVLIFMSFVLLNCNSATSQNLNTETERETPQTPSAAETKSETPQLTPTVELPKQQKVDFKGVRFTYNPQIFGEVEVEEVEELPLAQESDKPDSVAPRHILFKIKTSDKRRESSIYIFPIEDFRRMLAVSAETRNYFDEKIKDLKDATTDLKSRKDELMPRIPLWDGSQSIQVKLKQLPFQSGKGVIYLTQFDIEPSLINNEGLIYCFQGLTGDGKYYVLAEFAVELPFLPESYQVFEFEEYNLPIYFYKEPEKNQKQYEKYTSKIAKRLEKLQQDEFDPNLNYFEELISTLKVEK